MDTTQASLLLRIRNREDSQAWREFVGLYRPMLVRFARARGLDSENAEDVAQHCLAAIAQHIERFEYDPSRGFRKWLRTLANNRVRELLRKHRESPADSADFNRPQHREQTPEAVWEQLWMEDHLDYCLRQISAQVEKRTYEAFHHCAIDQWPVERVCRELGMKADQVYVAKSRVTQRLGRMMRELLAETG
jgi:RNA polymerase sigma-70 factor (ECF subfamily)